jgi:hypothetical protein
MIYIENIIFQAELFYFDKPTVAIMGFYCELPLIRAFILPILTYGLEIVLPKGKNLDNINRQYKKWIKQILSLNTIPI